MYRSRCDGFFKVLANRGRRRVLKDVLKEFFRRRHGLNIPSLADQKALNRKAAVGNLHFAIGVLYSSVTLPSMRVEDVGCPSTPFGFRDVWGTAQAGHFLNQYAVVDCGNGTRLASNLADGVAALPPERPLS
jgi:hypothetical protein